jgi:RNA polymerase sigma-70 factor (ECF subfamily)
MSLEDLLTACAANGNATDWQEFVRRFHPLIAAVVLRTAQHWGGVSSTLADDLIQETYLKICADQKRLLIEFKPHHPEAFYGYLKVVTANVVHDYFRAERSQKRGSGQPEVSVDDIEGPVRMDPASPSERIYRDILFEQVDGILCSYLVGEEQSRDRIIFWLYYRDGLTAPEIARLPSISLTVKGVESLIYRLTRVVRERITVAKPG